MAGFKGAKFKYIRLFEQVQLLVIMLIKTATLPLQVCIIIPQPLNSHGSDQPVHEHRRKNCDRHPRMLAHY